MCNNLAKNRGRRGVCLRLRSRPGSYGQVRVYVVAAVWYVRRTNGTVVRPRDSRYLKTFISSKWRSPQIYYQAWRKAVSHVAKLRQFVEFAILSKPLFLHLFAKFDSLRHICVHLTVLTLTAAGSSCSCVLRPSTASCSPSAAASILPKLIMPRKACASSRARDAADSTSSSILVARLAADGGDSSLRGLMSTIICMARRRGPNMGRISLLARSADGNLQIALAWPRTVRNTTAPSLYELPYGAREGGGYT